MKVSTALVSNVRSREEVAFASEVGNDDDDGVLVPNVSADSLSEELLPLCPRLNLPAPAIEAIAQKASDILITDNGIVSAPGQGADARMVMSKSGQRPHLVVPKKNGGMACDSDCPQYRSAAICSHVVAAAKHNGHFELFLIS